MTDFYIIIIEIIGAFYNICKRIDRFDNILEICNYCNDYVYMVRSKIFYSIISEQIAPKCCLINKWPNANARSGQDRSRPYVAAVMSIGILVA